MGFNEQDTVIYRLVIFVLTLTFTIVGIHNISKYNAILNDTDDTHIGLSRGTVIWFKWLNIIMVIVCLGLFIYNLWRIIFVKSVKFAIPDAFFNESKGLVNVDMNKNVNEQEENLNQALATGAGIQKSVVDKSKYIKDIKDLALKQQIGLLYDNDFDNNIDDCIENNKTTQDCLDNIKNL